MDERLRFVARVLEGENMSALCREFGISRPTGYKFFNRYKDLGLEALEDRSRRPYRHANKLPFQVERSILAIKHKRPTWGAPTIRDKLIKDIPMIKPPAKSTIHAVLDRHGLVKRRKRRRHKAEGTPLSHTHSPNGLWCADYKGEFMLGNRQYCYPLTVTDYHSRFLLACEGLTCTKPASFSLLQQQSRFDEFIEIYNNDRPHQALGGRYPGELYTPSPKTYRSPDEPEYPFHDRTVRVTRCGRICIGHRKVNLSTVFAGQVVGIREVDDRIWLAGRPDPSFMDYDLGYFDEEEARVEPGPNPFIPEV
tara:strand:+ start:4212 stop:5135 length:924 start_codon:yes stop_codon:yes gene_type:complete